MSQMTEAHKAQKKAIYERLSPRRRKFVDKIGYDKWDPFQLPKDPIEIREDPTRRTAQQLATEFLRSREEHQSYDQAYAAGALECAVGLINSQDRIVGMYEFSVWYNELLKKEGLKYDREKAIP